MEKQFIQLKKDNIIRVGIKDAEGKDTGEHLEFDLEDVELPLRMSEGAFKHQKNIEWLNNQLTILDKKEDKKGNKMLSWKEEEKLKLLKKFFSDEEKALDLFIGKGGTKKLLNGRNYYYTMYDDLMDVLEPIFPIIEKNSVNIKDKIKKQYSIKKDEELL